MATIKTARKRTKKLPTQYKSPSHKSIDLTAIDDVYELPLPNSAAPSTIPDSAYSRLPFLSNITNMFDNIAADEIILLGLIVLLLLEGTQDGFLILILLYLLFAEAIHSQLGF